MNYLHTLSHIWLNCHPILSKLWVNCLPTCQTFECCLHKHQTYKCTLAYYQIFECTVFIHYQTWSQWNDGSMHSIYCQSSSFVRTKLVAWLCSVEGCVEDAATLEENTNRNLQSELCKSAIPVVGGIRKVTSLSTRSVERDLHTGLMRWNTQQEDWE